MTIPDDVFIRMVSLPLSVKAVTLPNADGSYDIYVNSSLTLEQRSAVVLHELEHIRHDDFYRPVPVPLAEQQAG